MYFSKKFVVFRYSLFLNFPSFLDNFCLILIFFFFFFQSILLIITKGKKKIITRYVLSRETETGLLSNKSIIRGVLVSNR